VTAGVVVVVVVVDVVVAETHIHIHVNIEQCTQLSKQITMSMLTSNHSKMKVLNMESLLPNFHAISGQFFTLQQDSAPDCAVLVCKYTGRTVLM